MSEPVVRRRPIGSAGAVSALADLGSRAATDALLAGLRAGRWRPGAWGRFLADATGRSLRQAGRHPRALAEVTVLHLAVAAFGGRRWAAVSWALAAGHLGMLDDRAGLGLPNAITLLRANLPALGMSGLGMSGRWLPALALATDLADGRLARRMGAETPFGAHADSLADAAFWTWFALRHEPSRAVRAAALAAWVAPVVAVSAGSIAGGRMLDAPRPALLRPAAAMQAVLAARAALRPAP